MTKDELLNMQVSWVSSTTSKQVAHQSLRAALAAIRNGENKQDILRMPWSKPTTKSMIVLRVHYQQISSQESLWAAMPSLTL